MQRGPVRLGQPAQVIATRVRADGLAQLVEARRSVVHVVVALVPLGDTLIVLRNGGTKAVAFGIHFATAVVVLISSALLFAV